LLALEAMAGDAAFAAKETMFIQGEEADAVYTITAGLARLYKLLPDGRRQIVGFALPGDFLGLAMRERYGFSADAVEPVAACRFSRAAYSAFVDARPHLLRRLHEFATHELTLAQDQMMLLGRRTAEEKLVSFLLHMRDRWARLGRASVTVPLPMSRQDIADSLGLTIETVSRTFTKLAKDKAIAIVPDGVRLMNLERLETLAAA
jgi:CRP/FNR family transcriptional regulator